MKGFPWAPVGFVLGALLGFAYGQKARQKAPDAVSADFKDGVAVVKLDTIKLLRGGLPDFISRVR